MQLVLTEIDLVVDFRKTSQPTVPAFAAAECDLVEGAEEKKGGKKGQVYLWHMQ